MSISKFHSEPLQCGIAGTQSLGLQSCAQFYPAVLKFSPNQSLGWHIEYYARSANDSKLVRYRVRINLIKRRYRLMSEFYEYAKMMVTEINASLSQGWIPNQSKAISSAETTASTVPNALMTMPASYAPTNSAPIDEHISSVHTYVTMINELQKEVAQLKDIVAKSSASFPIVSELGAAQSKIEAQPIEFEFVPSIPTKVEEPTKTNSSSDGISLVDLLDRFIAAKEPIVRKDTMRSYYNYAKFFKAYLEEFLPGIKAQDFSRADAQAYMAYREEEMMKANIIDQLTNKNTK